MCVGSKEGTKAAFTHTVGSLWPVIILTMHTWNSFNATMTSELARLIGIAILFLLWKRSPLRYLHEVDLLSSFLCSDARQLLNPRSSAGGARLQRQVPLTTNSSLSLSQLLSLCVLDEGWTCPAAAWHEISAVFRPTLCPKMQPPHSFQ